MTLQRFQHLFEHFSPTSTKSVEMHNVNGAAIQIVSHLSVNQIIDAMQEDLYLNLHFYSKMFS